MSYQINIPSIMHIGAGSSEKVAEVLQQIGCSKPFIVTDKLMLQLGYCEKITHCLQRKQITASVFSDTVPEPTVSSVETGVEQLRNGNFDSIIALGGGSPIDSAKAISLLAKHGGKVSDYKVPAIVTQTTLPLIAIPTTAGTGSEATRVMVITDEQSTEKMLCVGSRLIPSAALIDYELTLSVPPRTTADTGIDSLTHAIEAYISKKANTFSDAQALAAMRLIAPNIRKAFHDGNNRQAREAMMLGATFAGIAFSNASVALVHGMSRPIGALFHVPHGLSNAMLLPTVTKYSIDHAIERYADCARAMGVSSYQDSNDKANHKLLDELHALNIELQVPTPEKYGIEREVYFSNLELMAVQAKDSGSPDNNPRVPDITEIMGLYQQLWA